MGRAPPPARTGAASPPTEARAPPARLLNWLGVPHLAPQARAGIAIDGKTVEVKPALPKEVMNGDTEGGGGTKEPASPERVEFAEGMQYIETYSAPRKETQLEPAATPDLPPLHP